MVASRIFSAVIGPTKFLLGIGALGYAVNESMKKDELAKYICKLLPRKASIEVLSQRSSSEQELKNRFDGVYKSAKRTARIGANGGTLFDYIASYVQSHFKADSIDACSADDKIDLNKADAFDILLRAKYFVQIGDIKAAVGLLNLLEGQSARLVGDWMADARTYLERKFIEELALANASVESIRQVKFEENAVKDDTFVQGVISYYPKPLNAACGFYTEQELKERFQRLYKAAKRKARIGSDDEGFFKYLVFYAHSLLKSDLIEKCSADEKNIDPEQADVYEVLLRAKYFVERFDFDPAIRLMSLLQGEPARLSEGWIVDAKKHLEQQFLNQLLMAHAIVESIRAQKDK